MSTTRNGGPAVAKMAGGDGTRRGGRWLSVFMSALMCFPAAATIGCAENQGKAPKRLTARSTWFLEGVPVPSGFQLEDRNSEDITSGGQRWARHWYRGNASVQGVRSFYLEHMPDEGWNLVSDQNVKGVVTLRFERKGEACAIQIEPSWNLLARCRIQVVVSPFDRRGGEGGGRRTPAPMAP